MTVFQGWPGKSYFRAKMEWNGEETITGKMALSIESAIEDLDTLLREDAAKECAS